MNPQPIVLTIAARLNTDHALFGRTQQEGQRGRIWPIPGGQIEILAKPQFRIEVDRRPLVAGPDVAARCAAHAPNRADLEQARHEFAFQQRDDFRLQLIDTWRPVAGDDQQRYERQYNGIDESRNHGTAASGSPGSPGH